MVVEHAPTGHLIFPKKGLEDQIYVLPEKGLANRLLNPIVENVKNPDNKKAKSTIYLDEK